MADNTFDSRSASKSASRSSGTHPSHASADDGGRSRWLALGLGRDAGDANLGQTILRLAGLAEAVHRFEHVRDELGSVGMGMAPAAMSWRGTADGGGTQIPLVSTQVVANTAITGQVRKDAGAGGSSQPRTEVGR